MAKFRPNPFKRAAGLQRKKYNIFGRTVEVWHFVYSREWGIALPGTNGPNLELCLGYVEIEIRPR